MSPEQEAASRDAERVADFSTSRTRRERDSTGGVLLQQRATKSRYRPARPQAPSAWLFESEGMPLHRRDKRNELLARDTRHRRCRESAEAQSRDPGRSSRSRRPSPNFGAARSRTSTASPRRPAPRPACRREPRGPGNPSRHRSTGFGVRSRTARTAAAPRAAAPRVLRRGVRRSGSSWPYISNAYDAG